MNSIDEKWKAFWYENSDFTNKTLTDDAPTKRVEWYSLPRKSSFSYGSWGCCAEQMVLLTTPNSLGHQSEGFSDDLATVIRGNLLGVPRETAQIPKNGMQNYHRSLAALEAMPNLTPLHILIECEAIEVMHRLSESGQKVGNKRNAAMWKKVAPSIHRLYFSTDHMTQTFKFDRKFLTSIPDRSVPRLFGLADKRARLASATTPIGIPRSKIERRCSQKGKFG